MRQWRTGIRWTPQGDAVLRRVMMVRRRADHSRHTDRALGTFRLSGQLSIRGCDGAELSEVASIVPAYRGKSLPGLSGAKKSSKKIRSIAGLDKRGLRLNASRS
jgi:hypothetical protein